MPAKITKGVPGKGITYEQFKNLPTAEYDGVVFIGEGDEHMVGVYVIGTPRLLLIEDDGGTILLDDADNYFPLVKAAPGITVTFSN